MIVVVPCFGWLWYCSVFNACLLTTAPACFTMIVSWAGTGFDRIADAFSYRMLSAVEHTSMVTTLLCSRFLAKGFLSRSMSISILLLRFPEWGLSVSAGVSLYRDLCPYVCSAPLSNSIT